MMKVTRIFAGILLAITAPIAGAIDVYQAPTVQKYEAKPVQEYKAKPVHEYKAPTVQVYKAPTVQEYKAPTVQEYKAPTVQAYKAPTTRPSANNGVRRQGGGAQVHPFGRGDLEEMHRNDVAAGRTRESMGRGAAGGGNNNTAARDRLNHYSNMNALNNRMNQSGTIGYNPYRNE